MLMDSDACDDEGSFCCLTILDIFWYFIVVIVAISFFSLISVPMWSVRAFVAFWHIIYISLVFDAVLWRKRGNCSFLFLFVQSRWYLSVYQFVHSSDGDTFIHCSTGDITESTTSSKPRRAATFAVQYYLFPIAVWPRDMTVATARYHCRGVMTAMLFIRGIPKASADTGYYEAGGWPWYIVSRIDGTAVATAVQTINIHSVMFLHCCCLHSLFILHYVFIWRRWWYTLEKCSVTVMEVLLYHCHYRWALIHWVPILAMLFSIQVCCFILWYPL